MLPNNLNIYITDKDNIGNFLNRNITHWFTFYQPGSDFEPNLKLFGENTQVFPYLFHDAWDKSIHPEILIFPTVEHIMDIVKRAMEIKKDLERGEQVNLLFNCYAGISRSPAAAYIVLCAIMGEWNERACWSEIQSRRPIAKPNPLMVQIADDHLNREWKMIAPLKNVVDHCRGNDDCLLF